MLIKKIDKRAELTSTQLITIIILIVSFAIIIAFFFMLNLRSNIDKESCRNSVIMRGAVPIFKDVVTLKCKTQDICFSMGGDCNVKGENVEKIKVDSKTGLMREMAGLLVDCWWMMGEGKIDYSSSGSCAICYKVYFDENIKGYEEFKVKNGIPYSDLYNYTKRDMPNTDQSYLSYFYELSSIDSVKNQILESNKINIDTDVISFDKDYAVVTSIVKSQNHNPPIYVKFSANELKDQAKCSNYITEN